MSDYRCDCPRVDYAPVHTEKCIRDHKSYKDYVQKPITQHLAPTNALPKWSKGDNPRYRDKEKFIKSRKIIATHEAPIYKTGKINIAGTKRLLKDKNDKQ